MKNFHKNCFDLLGKCPDGWLNAGELGGCYLFAPNGPGLNWQQSVDYCASIGGYLTDILNQETETFLDNSGFVQSNPNVRWWIGGNDIAQVSTSTYFKCFQMKILSVQ